MSTSRKEGKDVIVFATADDLKEQSNVKFPQFKPPASLILDNGEINWDCPCIEHMVKGPCSLEFKEAFLCFYKSKTDPKGMECSNSLSGLRLCMAEYPHLYSNSLNIDNNVDTKLSDAEKTLISDDSVTEASESLKVGSFRKVEGKPADNKSNAPTEQKLPLKSSTPATGTLKINV